MGKMAKDQPEPRGKAPKEARVAGIKNKLRRSEEMKKIRREKKKVFTSIRNSNLYVTFLRKKKVVKFKI